MQEQASISYSDYKPKSLDPQFPQPLSTLYDPGKVSASYTELLNAAEVVVVEITQKQPRIEEQATRDQSNSSLWFQMRAGSFRISI